MERKANRLAKNSVFIDMFEQPEYQLQMLQVFHPEMTDVTPDDIQTITLKQVVTNHPYNDLALLVKGVLMVFVEAQSTWSVNVAMRILLYYAETLMTYIHDHDMDIHDQARLNLPKPEFYVIYTGANKISDTLSLRNDFFHDQSCPIELQARVFTAETEDIIGQYIIFSHVLDAQVKEYGRTEQAVRETIRICKDKGVLRTYLQTREKEVINIMVMLFDQEYAMNAYAKHQAILAEKRGIERGMERGLQQGMERGRISVLYDMVLDGLISMKDAAKRANMTVDEFEAEAKALLN